MNVLNFSNHGPSATSGEHNDSAPQRSSLFSLSSVFITGGTSGIGEGLALRYLKEGRAVAVAGRRKSLFEQSALLQWSKENGGHLFFYEMDVTSWEQTQASFKAFEASLCELKLPTLGLVIASAGIGNPNKQQRPDFDLAAKILNINLLGSLYTARAAYESFTSSASASARKHGHLVFISSVAAKVGLATNGPYCASKAGLVTMAEAFAQDWKSVGIQVSVYLPGFVDTPLTKKNNHHMPFLMTCEQAVNRIARNIDQKKFYDIFPWPTALFVIFLSWIPKNIYVAWMQRCRFYKTKT